MPRIVALSGLLFVCLILLSCGGGGSGSHGTDYTVSFGVTGDGGANVGLGSSRTVMATVLKFDGATPAPGIKVSFSIKQDQSGASIERIHSETQSDGTAAAVYVAGNNPGVDIIEVKAGGARGSISFNVAGGGLVVSTLIVSADPDNVEIGDYSTIRVGGRTFDDQPAVGAQVDFSFQVNNSNGAFIHESQRRQQVSKFLDNEGWATLTYRAGNSSGVDIIQVNLPQAVHVRDTITINVGQGRALGDITLEAFKLATPETWQIRAVVHDRDGNLAPGVLVNFNVNNGNISASEVLTNINGVAEVVLSDTYWATVYARVENVHHKATVSIYEYFEAGSVVIEAPDRVDGESVVVRAKITNKDGLPLVDIPVNFESDGGSLDPNNTSTNVFGEASTMLSVVQSGQVRLWANVGNISASKVIDFNLPLEITTIDPPTGNLNENYGYQLLATGGILPYSWKIVAGNLPPGLTLNPSTGLIAGIPTATGWSSFIVEVVGADGSIGRATLAIEIVFDPGPDPDPIEITTTELPSGIQNSSYGFQLRATGGTLPYTWRISSGSLPRGLALNRETGLISGVPTESGWFSFIVEVQDIAGLRGFASMSLEIETVDPDGPVITTTTLPSGIQNSSYGFQLRATGGTLPYTWMISSGSLPPGLSLNPETGLISGVPTESGWYSFNVEVRDARGLRGTASLSVEIEWDRYSLEIQSGPELEPAIVNTFYTEVLEAEGGRRPYSWEVISGSLPDGLDTGGQFRERGIISGQPTRPGQYNFVARVTDADNNEHYQRMRIVVSSQELVITTTSPLPDAVRGQAYEHLLAVEGGGDAVQWSVLDSIVPNDPFGTIPQGLNLQGDGLIRGIPSTVAPAGTYSFMVRVADADDIRVTLAYKRFELTLR